MRSQTHPAAEMRPHVGRPWRGIWKSVTLCNTSLRITAKYMVMSLGTLLISRARTYKKELGMEESTVMTNGNSSHISESASHHIRTWHVFSKSCSHCCHYACQTSNEFLFSSILIQRHTQKGVLEDLVSRTNKSKRTVHHSLYLISLVFIHIILAIFNFQIYVIDFTLKD